VDDYSARLLEGVTRVVDRWASRLVDDRLTASGIAATAEARRGAIDAACSLAISAMSELLALDPEQQRSNPLAILRDATVPLGVFLTSCGVGPIERDEFSQRSFPDDVHGLSPATWADVDPTLVEPGLEWGAWKAATIISRRRDERS